MTARPRPHRPVWFSKDVLRVGNWRIGPHVLHVTTDTLDRLVANFRLAKARGVRIPVVWNHSADARDQVGWIDDLFVRGPELFARFWAVNPADVARIGRANQETSVELVRNFVDGLGRRYSPMIAHLGIVQHPVVHRQRPFVQLSLLEGAPNVMNNASFAPVGPTVQDQAKQFKLADIARIVATVNRILKALGSLLLLPDDTNEKELADRLNSIAGQLGPDPSDPDSQATTESSHRADVVTPSDVNPLAAMDNNGEVAQLRLQLSQTRQQLTVERQRNALDRERLFVGSVDRMIEQGRLTPADRTSIVEAGRSAGFALSLLKPFERIAPESAFPTQRLASRQAQVKEPAIGNGGAMTDERARELARRFAD